VSRVPPPAIALTVPAARPATSRTTTCSALT